MASLAAGASRGTRDDETSQGGAMEETVPATTKLSIPVTSSSETSVAGNSSYNLPVEAHGRNLSELFDAATAKWYALETGSESSQDTVKACISEFEACAKIIRSESVFSPNETLKDLSTRRLSYMMVPFRLAEMQDKVKIDLSAGPEPRLRLLKRADAYLSIFLQQCISHQIADEGDADRYSLYLEGHKGNDSDVDVARSRARGSPEVQRERKIQSFQRHRSAQKRIAEIIEIRESRGRRRGKRKGRLFGAVAAESGTNSCSGGSEEDDDNDSEELERERVLLVLQNCIRDSLDMLDSHQRELPMLSHMVKMMGGTSQSGERSQRSDPRVRARKEAERKKAAIAAYQNRPGLSLTHIGPDGSVRREQLKAQVFRPGWRQPTMTLDELAEIEVRDAMARKQRQDAAEASDDRPGMKIKELEAAGKEDNLELVDKATQRDRQWDDWKDMNPKGYGVTKKI